jgi:hypothetical protein
MTNAFEYGDEMLQQATSPVGIDPAEKPQESPQVGSNQPYLNLAT